MINLLPPEIKKQKKYARFNVVTIRYTAVIIGVAAAITASLLITQALSQAQLESFQAELETAQVEAKRRSGILDEGKVFEAKLEAADDLLNNESQYTKLLNDIEKSLISNARIKNLTLTGDETEPLRLSIETTNRDLAPTIARTLVKSPRFTAADVQSITEVKSDNSTIYQIEIVVAYAEGAAR